MASSPFFRSRWVFLQPDLRLPGLVMFGRYQIAASQSGLLPHSHPNAIEICFLERGEQTYRVGRRIYRLRGNDQFFTLPGEIHDTARLPQERGILYWLILKLEPVEKFLGLSETMARQLRRELQRMPTRHFRAHPNCSRILGQMIELLSKRKPAPFPALRLLRLQTLLLDYLTLTIESSHSGARELATPLIQRVLRHVEQRLEEPIQVARLADVARLSESRFKARFKRETGVPPAEFWLRKKIERATSLLKTRSVTEVAHALGFSSSQYFATTFKRYTLTSPRDFLAQAGRSARHARDRFAV
ncbi:MAG: AraC family transcriptional regulator [Methylacidiphilales bacterium]|nr:AraC family transcriptional regulator [Candidatus Methylacidiphilales bacterium]